MLNRTSIKAKITLFYLIQTNINKIAEILINKGFDYSLIQVNKY